MSPARAPSNEIGTVAMADDAAPRLGRNARLGLAATALAFLAVLGLARWLRPDPRGFGTHRQLGLPPCEFRATTGYPCPACGMTTAFAWMTRGRLEPAWRANPAGCALAPLTGALALWLLAAAWRGRPVGTKSLDTPLVVLVIAAAALSLIAWAARLAGITGG